MLEVEQTRIHPTGDVTEKYRLLRVMEHKMQFQERVINHRKAEARRADREIRRKMLYKLGQVMQARKCEDARKKKEEAEWKAKQDKIAETQRQRDQELEERERRRKNSILRRTPVVRKPAKPYYVPRKQFTHAPSQPPAKSDKWTSGKKFDRGMPAGNKGRAKFPNMGGCPIEVDHGFTSPLTLVLVGKTGNGKSATGNSIIGDKKFESKPSSSGVTTTSELNTTVLEDGRRLHVIDTPGLFDSSLDPKFIKKEIFGCIDLAKHGVHGVLVVFSVRSRFSEEETAVISTLVTLFGRRIYNYIIVVFTSGDELDHHKKTLDEFLSDCPQSLKEMLNLCGNRCVLFDNRTEDKTKKSNQLKQLFSYVNMVLKANGGEPLIKEIFTEWKFVTKLKEIRMRFEQLFIEERIARLKAEENAKNEQMKSKEDINKLIKELESVKQAVELESDIAKQAAELESAKKAAEGRCVIL